MDAALQTTTVTATEFKAKCLQLLDQVNSHQIERLEITKRGKVFGVLTAPSPRIDPVKGIYGFMAGTVNLPEGLDLTEPVLDEPLDAEQGILHR
jgi:hypothetical protein